MVGSDSHPVQEIEEPQFRIAGISIRVSGVEVEPRLVNPDFLRHNDVVGPDWTVESPVLVGNSPSEVNYSNGILFVATEDIVVIAQHWVADDSQPEKTWLREAEVICCDAAVRYLQATPPSPWYNSVSINVAATVETSTEHANHSSSLIKTLGNQLTFGGLVPSVELQAKYAISDDTTATTHLFEHDVLRNETSPIFFTAEMTHDIEEKTSELSVAAVVNVIKRWEADIAVIRNLGLKYYSLYMPPEGTK